MKDAESWHPTKYLLGKGGWTGSPDPSQLFVGSRLVANLQIPLYHKAIIAHCKGHLLDHGCGNAPLFGMYSPLCTEVTCVDWPSSLHDKRHVDQYCNLNERLPFADQSFDTILSSDVVEHLYEHDLIFSEFHRLLRPGGKVILGTPFLYWIHESPHDYFRLTEYAVRHFAQTAHLGVIEIDAYGGAREVLEDIALKLATSRSLRIGALFHRILVTMRRVFPSRMLSRGIFPLGYIAVLERADIK
jgi:SAM-dependent methyltransferase